MSFHCYNCGGAVEAKSGGRVSRRDECPACSADLHVCLNCRHHDQGAYNECREPQAERVVDKRKANYCDYFELGSGSAAADDSADARKRLDDLFK